MSEFLKQRQQKKTHKQFARWYFGIYYTRQAIRSVQIWIMCATQTTTQPHDNEAIEHVCEQQCEEVVRMRKTQESRETKKWKKQAETFAAFFHITLPAPMRIEQTVGCGAACKIDINIDRQSMAIRSMRSQ